jgi:DNA invertase Pin-like site-specific DNA recombinase
MKIGYARVSTREQNLDLQIDALKAAGCEKLFTDEGVSGTVKDRSGLDAALAAVGEADTLIVWKLDRLGRSLGFLIELIDHLGKTGAGFVALQDGIDTTTSGGKLVFHIMGALADFERTLISERTTAGIAAARRRGKHIGRPAALSREQVVHAKKAIEQGETVSGMASVLGVHRNTLRRAIRSRQLVAVKG